MVSKNAHASPRLQLTASGAEACIIDSGTHVPAASEVTLVATAPKLRHATKRTCKSAQQTTRLDREITHLK